jgi:hypothetical protein
MTHTPILGLIGAFLEAEEHLLRAMSDTNLSPLKFLHDLGVLHTPLFATWSSLKVLQRPSLLIIILFRHDVF